MWRSSTPILPLRHLLHQTSALLDLIFPPLCPGCNGPTPGGTGLCPACQGGFPHLPAAHCSCCALPFHTAEGSPHRCGDCQQSPPPYRAVVTGGCHEGVLREMIHRFKYRGDLRLDRTLAQLLVPQLPPLLPRLRAPVLIPIPLHPSRLRERGYNQSLLIARVLGRRLKLPVLADTLIRIRPTQTQQRLRREARHRNVRGAFRCTPLKGRSVILIDDVMTSGATATEAAHVLRKAGAGDVVIGALARAPLF